MQSLTPYIRAHVRNGTSVLAATLHRNYECGVGEYEELSRSHTRLPDGDEPFVTVLRPLLASMLSLWAARDHAGIRADVTFGEMLRTPWESMPRSADASRAFHDGAADARVCAPREFTGTLLARWLRVTRAFTANAAVVVTYEDCVCRPLAVCERIAARFHLERHPGGFQLVQQRVGWWCVGSELPTVTESDLRLIARYEQEL